VKKSKEIQQSESNGVFTLTKGNTFDWRGILISGCIKWRIKVIRECKYFMVGVVSEAFDLERSVFGSNGWYVHSNSELFSQVGKIHKSWVGTSFNKVGDVVECGFKSGNLEITVNGLSYGFAYTSLSESLYVAIQMYDPGSVLSWEKLE
jgi:hypothetical protein